VQGDSGFVVIRDGRVVAKSKPLQHYFDCPLQFGSFPEFVEATDTADMADSYKVPLAPGDIIVAGELKCAFLL
jgi:protein phosphatase PTC7